MEIDTQRSVTSLATFPSATSTAPTSSGPMGLGLDISGQDGEDYEYFPLENFTLVCRGVYRSSFPKKKNFAFMKKLGLKSVLYVAS